MLNALNIFTPQDETHPSAKVVDGKLILSFPNALKPVLWQMDFAHVKASALEVDQTKEGKKEIWALNLKTTKGDTVEIAPFETREDAVRGLLAASKALEAASGQINPVANATSSSNPAPHYTGHTTKKRRWPTIVLGLIACFTFFLWYSTIPRPIRDSGLAAPNRTATATTGSSEAPTTGVPMSADDFLNSR